MSRYSSTTGRGAANLDGDTDIDLAVTAGDAAGFVAVYLNNNGVFSGPTVFPVGGANPSAIVAADLDLNGRNDLVVTNEGSGTVSILPNNGAGGFGAATILPVGTHPDQLAAADLDGNTSADLAVTSRDSSITTVFLNTRGAACYANCDNSTSPPILNVSDFLCFQARFAAGEPYANCDGSTTPPVLNIVDFICFMNAFASGCP
jgi:hypothetical protein